MSFSMRNFGAEMESHPVLAADEIASLISENSHRNVLVSGWKQTCNNFYWHLKTDSTCGGGEKNGWEIVSYKASGLNDVTHISKIAGLLGSHGLVCGTDCGFHVHVDISDFSPEQASILLAYWVKIERLMMESVPRHRSYSRHCKLLKNKIGPKSKFYDPLTFWDSFGPKNFSIHNNRDKKVTMNLVNYATCLSYAKGDISPDAYCDRSRKTVEFRFPEGTFEEKEIKNWIYLFVNFVEHISKKNQMPNNIRAVKSIEEFISILGLKEDLLDHHQLKTWLFNRICKNGVSKKWRKMIEKCVCATK